MKKQNSGTSYTAGALFAGIGGFCSGFDKAAISTKWAVEWDAQAAKTYRKNFPGVELLERDVRDLNACNLSPVDVLHAGFPCQSFSQAGRREGFEDERGRTFFEIIRLLKEWGDRRPSVLVLENSPFLRDGRGGEWYLEIQSAIRRAGYWFADTNARVLGTNEHTALPQDRNRLFMVAFSTDAFWDGSFRWPDPLAAVEKKLEGFVDFDADVGSEYYLSRDNKYYRMISDLRSEDHEIYQLRKYIVRPKVKGTCPTLTANMGKGGHNVPFIFTDRGLRKLTEHECLRLQGFGEDFLFPDDVPRHSRYTQVGNSVAPPMAAILAKVIREKLKERKLPENEQDNNRIQISKG
ncbi:DNA cytosine methyltransferase [Loktanella salsilacus]|uniref:DNA cytosine methyltransferase n=1 Tax=Loktanella salsilacus TaxID=195913 RepID=UPI003703B990